MDLDGEGFGVSLAFEVGPAALFGAAVGFALEALLAQAVPLAASCAAGLAAFLAAWRGLRFVGSTSELRLAQFEQLPLDPEQPDQPEEELTATEAELPPPSTDQHSSAAEELLLDDILASLGPDSRVVRLFQPVKTPTPGELQARIDDHLRSVPPPAAPADASAALHEALAELRRSLR